MTYDDALTYLRKNDIRVSANCTYRGMDWIRDKFVITAVAAEDYELFVHLRSATGYQFNLVERADIFFESATSR